MARRSGPCHLPATARVHDDPCAFRHRWRVLLAAGAGLRFTTAGDAARLRRGRGFCMVGGGRGGWINRRYPQRLRRLAAAGVHFLADLLTHSRTGHTPRDPRAPDHSASYRRRYRTLRASGAPLPQRPRRILFVGRLVEKKGCAILAAGLGHPARDHSRSRAASGGRRSARRIAATQCRAAASAGAVPRRAAACGRACQSR